MSTIVIMPGGFHPFHAGHAALYNSARRAFPDAEVFVAATNDTSSRPFPFAVKEKLAKLAGVEPGHFVQVKSPFQAKEITQNFNPESDRLIFVRSEKDADKPPQAGGVKKDGNPAYLQPLLSAQRLEPFGRHAYMAYLPTVEFGPGMTSATEIRTAWPDLNDRRKTALVMSLYPATQKNPALAATVVKLLDTAIVTKVDEGLLGFIAKPASAKKIEKPDEFSARLMTNRQQKKTPAPPAKIFPGFEDYRKAKQRGEVEENQGWAATFTNETDAQNFVGGMTASYQDRENQPIAEKSKSPKIRDAEMVRTQQFIKQHYPTYSGDSEIAFDKWVMRSLKHSEQEDTQQDKILARLAAKIDLLNKKINSFQKADYIEEKWSKKYKSSINCANPRGFSQRAHCQGRKKK